MPSVFPLPNGAQIGYEILGSEHLGKGIRPLVLICGMSMRYEEWDPLSKPLARKRPVLLFDNRDFGASIVKTSAREEFTIATLAADAVSLIEHLGWKSVDFCGFSMGGGVLQQILITTSLPFTIGHAVLAATTTKAPHGDPEFLEYMSKLFHRAQQSGVRLTDAQRPDITREMGELNYDKEWLKDPVNKAKFERSLPTELRGRPVKVIAQQAQALSATDVRSSLPRISPGIQILVIHGTLDRLIHYAESEYIMRGIPHARRVTVDPSRQIPGSVPTDQFGHFWFQYFDTDVWMSVMETFLDDLQTIDKAKL